MILFARIRSLFCSIVFMFLLSVSTHADEGMWTFNGLPLGQLKEQYGFEVTPEWINHLMRSSVRFNNGGSGSFISSNGLTLTNHHVAQDLIASLSTTDRDLVQNGFSAHDFGQELKIPSLEIDQLIEIVDVTARVQAAIPEGATAEVANAARKKVIAEIEKESSPDGSTFKGEVKSLYNGGRYHLYKYDRFTDVRLVFAPEKAIGFFGGDADNFEFPRFNLDMTIVRVYRDGRPANTPDFLKKPSNPLAEGDLVFVSGNPGRTNRQYTWAHTVFMRDFVIPLNLTHLRRKEILLQQYGLRSAEAARQAYTDLLSVQNARKGYLGQRDALQTPETLNTIQRNEADLRARLSSTSSGPRTLEAWEKIAQIQTQFKEFYVPYLLWEGAQGFSSDLFGFARILVRASVEKSKPNGERLSGYQDAQLSTLRESLLSEAPIYPDLEIEKLADALSYLLETVPTLPEAYRYQSVVDQVLAGKSPKARAAELIRGNSLLDVRERERLFDGGLDAIQASDNPMIVLARLVDDVSRALLKKVEVEVLEPRTQAYELIAQARFQVFGDSIYPDATFSPRLSFGVVQGYTDHRGVVPSFTTIGGAFAHEKQHAGQGKDYVLPESWHDALRSGDLDLEVPYNFSSTLDIVGGNSGSPIVNRDGELVGLVFDGNIHSLGGSYSYDKNLNRAVAVDCRAMLHATDRVYRVPHVFNQWGK